LQERALDKLLGKVAVIYYNIDRKDAEIKKDFYQAAVLIGFNLFFK